MSYIWADGLNKIAPIGIATSYTGTNLTPILNSLGFNVVTTSNGSSIRTDTPLLVNDECSLSITSEYNTLSSGGYASWIQLGLNENTSTIIGSIFVSPEDLNNYFSIVFFDGTSAQCSITIDKGSGFISLRSGGSNGAILSSSVISLVVGRVYCIQWQIAIGTSGAYQINLGSATLFSGTGNTRGGSTNNQVNIIQIGYQTTPGVTGRAVMKIAHLILADNSGTTMNTIWNNSPCVLEDVPIADSSVSFTQSSIVLGQDYSISSSSSAPGSNTLFLRKYTPPVNMTLNSVSALCNTNAPAAKYTAVVYSDSAGVVGTLIASGIESTGVSTGQVATSYFGTVALTGGTSYWVGFITDTSWNIWSATDSSSTGVLKSNSYGSGAPASPTGFTVNQPSWAMWGNCSGAANNYVAEVDNPALGNSYNSSVTVGQEDLFVFPNMAANLGQIVGVASKVMVFNPSGGSRTCDLVISSSGNETNGNYSNFTMSASPLWVRSFTPVDPHTALTWSQSAVNAAILGYKVAS